MCAQGKVTCCCVTSPLKDESKDLLWWTSHQKLAKSQKFNSLALQ